MESDGIRIGRLGDTTMNLNRYKMTNHIQVGVGVCVCLWWQGVFELVK